jgi:hypothetical protein
VNKPKNRSTDAYPDHRLALWVELLRRVAYVFNMRLRLESLAGVEIRITKKGDIPEQDRGEVHPGGDEGDDKNLPHIEPET